MEARGPLGECVRAMAGAAALSDPRFAPVGPQEVDELVVDVSVLGPPRRVRSPDEVVVGRHGLVISRGTHRGVLLPQVAVDHGLDRDAFLSATCDKAGLPRGAWRDPGTTIEVFEAEVVEEARA
jgi:AmmeMemoRadiSam system protein A